MNKRWIYGVLVLSALTLAACQTGSTAATQTVKDIPVPQNVIVQGRVEPIHTIDLAFSANGRVAEVLANEGDLVEAGQVIARLGGQETRLADLARAGQEMAAAEQALKDLEDAAALNAAQAQVKIIEARNSVDDAQKKVDDLDAQYNPEPKDVEEAGARLTLAQAQLRSVEDYAARLQGGVDRDVLAAANNRRDTAETAVTAAQAALDGLELRAPLAGTLVGLDLQAGQFAAAGQLVGAVADFSAWVIQTDDLTELEVVRVSAGERARLILDALPGNEMTAEVVHIAQRFEEKRGDVTYTVTLAIQDPVDALRWGMTGQIRFVESE
jgi:HlyD family secretion protein